MSQKKIAVVVQRYGLEVNGGAELEARLYAERLTKWYDVTVLTTCAIDHFTWKNDYPAEIIDINGVHVHRFLNDKERNLEEFRYLEEELSTTGHSLAKEHEWAKDQGPFCPQLIQYIEANQNTYNAFIFMTYLYYQTIYGLPLVHNKSILVPTAHDEPAMYFKIMTDVMTTPRALFFNTPSEKRFVHKLFQNDHIPHETGGASVTLPSAPIDISDFRSRHGISRPYMIYVGRIEGGKGCAELIEYFHSYNYWRESQGEEPFLLVFVGKEIMPIPHDENILSLGFVSENDKYAAIMESEFLVLPSQFESLSIVVLEAFALSKAVLVNGNCEVLQDHCTFSNGGLYYQSVEEFCGCIDYLLQHPEIRQQMGLNGLHYQQKNYTWDQIMNKLSNLIEYVSGDSDEYKHQ